MINSRTKSVPNVSRPPAVDPLDPDSTSLIASQERFFPPNCIQIDPRIIIDSQAGTIAASVMVSEFWTGNLISLDARPAAKFPADMQSVAEWILELVTRAQADLSPF